MAYGSVNSLNHTIQHLLNSYRVSIVPSSTREILEAAGQCAERLLRTLERYDDFKNSSEEVRAVEARIGEVSSAFEDAIESQVSAQLLPQALRHGKVSLDLHHLSHEINCFIETAAAMVAEYLEELYMASRSDVEDKQDEGSDSEMVGLTDDFLQIRDLIAGDQTDFAVRVAVTGMAGIGKTTLVKKVFHDSLVKESFESRAFVRVGQRYGFRDILRAIVAQLDANGGAMVMDGDLEEYFMRILRGRKFLIVLDDVWEANFESRFKLPKDCDAYVLVTSRNQKTFTGTRYSTYDFRMQFLGEDDSWDLLRTKVFGKGGDKCTPELEKAGKEIAENCEGLPLLIIEVAKLLSEAQKLNLQYWEDGAKMRNSVFDDACNQIYEVLLPSYHYLEQNSKACFLYMVVFPRKHVVRRSKIVNLWRAEKFADDGVDSVVDDLVSSNLVVTRLQDWSLTAAKACNLHLVYRYLSKREAQNIKFLHVIHRDTVERIDNMRHVAIYHNTLLAMKEVHKSVESVRTLRSVLCTGPYHQYEVPICLELKLLRVLDAVSIRFYEFPDDVMELIQLRYLSLTTNASLSPSIHNLWFLQFLIVHQNLSIIRTSTKDESYVPVEIWELQELEHLQIVGRNLPQPPPGAVLPNLKELLDVGVQTCTQGVLDNVPNLEKLRVQIVLAPDGAQDLSCFDHISCLDKLLSLQIKVMNPRLLPRHVDPPRLLSISASRLKKLSLSGFGYPWDDMSTIAKLPRLQVLKLQCYAFRGGEWKAKGMRFSIHLEYLCIEDADLVHWSAARESFPRLRRLTMKNCHKLQVLPRFTEVKIEFIDCNPLAVTCARRNHDECDIQVKCSWKR